MSTAADVELRALLRRLRAAEDRLRADAASEVGEETDDAERAARAEGYAAGLGLAASWIESLRARLPHLAEMTERAEHEEQ